MKNQPANCRNFCSFLWMIIGIFLIVPAFSSWGSQTAITAVYVGEDEENGYRYEAAGIGGISVSISPDQRSDSIALITPDSGLSGIIYKDGFKLDLENEEFFTEKGFYEYYFYPSSDSKQMGVFSFTLSGIENIEEQIPFSVIEDPAVTITFHETQKNYVHTLPNGVSYQLTVPSGGLSTQPVEAVFPKDITVYGIQKDGEHFSAKGSYRFTEPGCYRIECMAGTSEMLNGNGNLYHFYIWFWIREYTIRDMDIFHAPEHFRIQRIWRNGVPIDPNGNFRYLHVKEDGVYRILFQEEEGNSQYILECKLDKEAPYLTFDKNFFDKNVYVPVSFQTSEQDCTIEIYRNGEKMAYTSSPIEEGGEYRIVVSDKVGNSREYFFFVLHNVKIFTPVMIILSILFVLGIVLWMFYQRRHMRVL